MTLDADMRNLMDAVKKTYMVVSPIKPRPEPRIGGGDRANLPVGYTFKSDTLATGWPLNTKFVQLPDGDWVPLVYMLKEYVMEIPAVEEPTSNSQIPVEMTLVMKMADGSVVSTDFIPKGTA